jgi:hypothetical protein
MLELLNSPPDIRDIARDFKRFGWLGFWLQIVLGVTPIMLLIFSLLFSGQKQPSTGALGSTIGLILAYVALSVLVFTIYWCYRYTRLAKRLDNPEARPPKADVIRMLWISIIVNIGGMISAIFIAIWKVSSMLFNMLLMPQGAIVTPAAPLMRSPLITPFDMITLQAIVNTMAAELVGLVIALWLLYRVNQHQA